MAETITADMVIHDIVTKFPVTVKVFHGHGFPAQLVQLVLEKVSREGHARIDLF